MRFVLTPPRHARGFAFGSVQDEVLSQSAVEAQVVDGAASVLEYGVHNVQGYLAIPSRYNQQTVISAAPRPPSSRHIEFAIMVCCVLEDSCQNTVAGSSSQERWILNRGPAVPMSWSRKSSQKRSGPTVTFYRIHTVGSQGGGGVHATHGPCQFAHVRCPDYGIGFRYPGMTMLCRTLSGRGPSAALVRRSTQDGSNSYGVDL